MKASEYFSTKAISASFLKSCSFSAHAGWKFLNEPNFQSDAMAFGSAVHTAILEPHLFNEQYCVEPLHAPKKLTSAQEEAFKKFPDLEKPTKAQVTANEESIKKLAFWNEFNLINKDKTLLSNDEFFKISKIKENCLAIPAVKTALDTFEKEKSILWKSSGMDFKARLDLVDESGGVVIDLKTTRDASERGFLRQLLELRYDIQLFHYLSSVSGSAAYAIAVETETCEVALYDLTDIVMSDFTKKRYTKALEVALEVMEMKECPNKFPNEIVSLKLPNWALESETV